MTTAVYYDLDEITIDDLRRARRRAGNATEFIQSDVSWPAQEATDSPQTVPGPRTFSYQSDLMSWVDRLFSALTAESEGVNRFPHQDPELLEIARYYFFFGFATIEQRWRALSDIVRTTHPARLIWVGPRPVIRQLRAAAGALLPTRIEFVASSNPTRLRTLIRYARRWVGPPLRRFRRRFLAWPAQASGSVSGRSSVVFTEYFPNNVSGLFPVAKALQERGVEPSWLAQREPVADALRRRGVVSNTMDQLVDGAAEERIPLTPAQRVELAAMLDRLPEQFYRGTGELIGPEYLKPALRNHLTASLEQARYWLAAILSSFDRLRPQCVVSTSYSSLPGRAAAVACRRFDGTSVYLQHGLFPDRSFFTRFCNDVLLLWGDSNRRFMIEQGIPADRVHVVGASNYDELIARSRESAAKSVPKPGAPLVVALMASRTAGAALSYSAAEACLANVARAVAEIPFARLIAKVHPGDKTGMVERTVGELPSCTIVKSGNSQDVILESDIVIVVSSTTGLEACVADKPLIVLEPVGFPSFGTYAQYGAALMVPLNGDRDWERIADAIQRLQSDPAIVGDLGAGRRRLVDDMLNGGRGDAAQLAAAAIAACAGASEPIAAHPLQGV